MAGRAACRAGTVASRRGRDDRGLADGTEPIGRGPRPRASRYSPTPLGKPRRAPARSELVLASPQPGPRGASYGARCIRLWPARDGPGVPRTRTDRIGLARPTAGLTSRNDWCLVGRQRGYVVTDAARADRPNPGDR